MIPTSRLEAQGRAIVPRSSRVEAHRSFVAAATAVFVAVALSACGSSTGATGATGTTGATGGTAAATQTTHGSGSPSGTTVAAQASSGCSASAGLPGAPAAGATATVHPVVSGVSRTVIVHVPSSYRSTTPIPLVLNLHGSQSTASAQQAFTGMDATSDQDGFIVAYPQAAIAAGSGFEWNVPGQPLFGGAPVPAGSADDVAFLQQLVVLLGQRYCLDEHRVFATGFSGGARMASQLGCDAAATFAAVAPVSGLRLPAPCPATRPMPVLSFHGAEDPVDPYGGNGQAYWTYSVPVAAARWAAQNGCSPSPTTSKPSSGVVVTTYGHCQGGAEVELQTITGEGHEWPGGPPLSPALTRTLGPQSSAVDANSTMWSFFEGHPL